MTLSCSVVCRMSALTTSMSLTLAPIETSHTELAYRAVVNIHGRLAIIGDMVIRATAALMLDEFTNRVRRNLESDMAAV